MQKDLNLVLSSELTGIDPAYNFDSVSSRVIGQCYEALFQFHYLKRPYVIEPLLADGHPIVSNNQKRYTIRIKKNIQYHDDPAFNGKKRYVKAQDFINQIKRLSFKKIKSPGWWTLENKIVGLDKFREKVGENIDLFYSESVEGLKAIDDHTLVIDLLNPFPQLKYILAMNITAPMPTEVLKRYNNHLNDRIVGTGPFIFKEWSKGSRIKLERFSSYHDNFYPQQGDRKAIDNGLLESAGEKLPFVKSVNFHIIKEPTQRWKMFKEKKVDFLNSIPRSGISSDPHTFEALTLALRKEGINLNIIPTLTSWWFGFNMKDPLLGKNRALRMAIAHAIDTSEYIKIFTNNTALKANSIFVPGTPGYNPSQDIPHTYNLEKSRKYLVAAGYPDGKNLPIINYDTRGANTHLINSANFIKKQLKKVGIKINIVVNTLPEFLNKSRSGELQFWKSGYSLDYPDAVNSLQLLYSKNFPPGPNSSFFSNKNFDSLYEKIIFLPTGKEKTRIMKKMEEIIYRELPWAMQYYERTYSVSHQNIKNYRYSNVIFNNLKYIKVE